MPFHAPKNYQYEPKDIRSNCGLQMSLLSGVNQNNNQDNIIPAQIHHHANQRPVRARRAPHWQYDNNNQDNIIPAQIHHHANQRPVRARRAPQWQHDFIMCGR